MQEDRNIRQLNTNIIYYELFKIENNELNTLFKIEEEKIAI
jgi:hypothetical protein